MSEIQQGITDELKNQTKISTHKPIETTERLRSLGISLMPIDGDDIIMVNERDFHGDYLIYDYYIQNMGNYGQSRNLYTWTTCRLFCCWNI